MHTKKLPVYLLHTSRIICGIVFLYSGFVKGIDPLGSTYKFVDYFVAFKIDFLEPVAFPLSILLPAAEMLIGAALITGITTVMASWAILVFMSFFTILTFFIALTDPVADCGCFGDAIILTNWETFLKNIVLMVFVIYMFIKRKEFKPFFTNHFLEWAVASVFLLIILGITAHSYRNLPVIDYRPFSIGANIEEKMSIPPDAPADEYDISIYYRKDGVTRAFSADSLPDPGWEWIRTESTLISRGYEPPLKDFYIESVDDGIDHTWDILYDQGYTFILVAYNLDKSSEKNNARINSLAEWSAANEMNFICLTASPEVRIKDFIERTGATYRFYHSDEITLKTIIRSNPGLLLLKEGTILGKWHYRNIPHADELKVNLLSYSMELQQQSDRKLVSYSYIMALIILLALLKSIRPYVNE